MNFKVVDGLAGDSFAFGNFEVVGVFGDVVDGFSVDLVDGFVSGIDGSDLAGM